MIISLDIHDYDAISSFLVAQVWTPIIIASLDTHYYDTSLDTHYYRKSGHPLL